MNWRVVILMLLSLHLVSCNSEPEKVEVTKTRGLTEFDKPRTPLVPIMPPEWRQVPSTKLRVYNYRFGVDGEVYISNSRGGVLPNVNRWLKQYDQPEVESVDGFQKLKVLGEEGVLVEAKGRFAGGMGKLPRENAGLLGAIIDFNGELLTVKMIGSEEEVAAEKERFILFTEGLVNRDSVMPQN